MKTENKNVKVREYRGYNNFQLRIRDIETPTGVSETIQDDSFTIRDIMERFTISGETYQEKQGLYQDEVSHESQDLRQAMAMDLVDRDELLSEVKIRQAMAAQKIRDEVQRVEDEQKQTLLKQEEQKREDEKRREGEALAKLKRSSKYDHKSDDEKE